MTAGEMTVTVRSRLREMVETALPWYDREAVAAQKAEADALIRRAATARRNAVRIREAYLASARRLGRK